MPTTIQIPNFKADSVKQQAFLAASIPAGSTSCQVSDPLAVSANDPLYLGSPAGISCEKVVVTSVSGSTVSFSPATQYAHAYRDQVVFLVADHYRVYRAGDPGTGQAPAPGTYSLIGTPDLDPQHPMTAFSDAVGGSGFWYLYTYYDAASQAESPQGDSTPVLGGDAGHYAELSDIRKEAGFDGADFVSDDTVDLYRDMAEQDVIAALSKAAMIPLPTPAPPMVKHLVRMLAAGYMMSADYGPSTSTAGIQKDGKGKSDWATKRLGDICSGAVPLIAADGVTEVSSLGSNDLPDTSDELVHGPYVAQDSEPYFSMDMDF